MLPVQACLAHRKLPQMFQQMQTRVSRPLCRFTAARASLIGLLPQPEDVFAGLLCASFMLLPEQSNATTLPDSEGGMVRTA